MDPSPMRLGTVVALVAALAAGGYAVGRATRPEQATALPRALPAVRPAPVAPRLPPAVGIPQLNQAGSTAGQSFTP
jgi:hypothetical protein